MNRFTLTMGLGIAASMLVGVPRTATAGEEVPFSADLLVEVVDYYKNGFLTEGVGEATHMGEVSTMGAVRVFGDRSTSVLVLSAANGDSLTFESASVFDPEIGHFRGVYMIREGTGRFAGATGYGTIEPVPLGGGQFNVLYDGVISY